MEVDQIKEFLKVLEKSDVEEFEWKKNGFHIRFVRQLGSAPEIEIKDKKSSKKDSKTVEPAPLNGEKKKEETVSVSDIVVKSPLVGIAFLDVGKGIIQEGKKVKKGEVLCRIEAMRVMREISALQDGTIRKVLIQDKSRVEYGTELFWIGE
ncbi:MAG TPA: biotin/lipoyl-containing protein [bacterium]|nr:biotin/lipoyl-containing protein [bacterium]